MNRYLLRRIVTPPLIVVASVFFLVEEVLWRLSAVYALLGRLPVFRQLEQSIAGLPPYGALAVFVVPSVVLAPVKFLALYLLAGGHPALGATTIIGAKIAGTALVARIYALTRPALVQLKWFAWLEAMVLGARRELHRWWADSFAGRVFVRVRLRFRVWREKKRSWLARRFAAIRARISGPGREARDAAPKTDS